VYVSQVELITALLKELDRQNPGVCMSQTAMNAVIAAANVIVAAKDGLTASSQETPA